MGTSSEFGPNSDKRGENMEVTVLQLFTLAFASFTLGVAVGVALLVLRGRR